MDEAGPTTEPIPSWSMVVKGDGSRGGKDKCFVGILCWRSEADAFCGRTQCKALLLQPMPPIDIYLQQKSIVQWLDRVNSKVEGRRSLNIVLCWQLHYTFDVIGSNVRQHYILASAMRCWNYSEYKASFQKVTSVAHPLSCGWRWVSNRLGEEDESLGCYNVAKKWDCAAFNNPECFAKCVFTDIWSSWSWRRESRGPQRYWSLCSNSWNFIGLHKLWQRPGYQWDCREGVGEEPSECCQRTSILKMMLLWIFL